MARMADQKPTLDYARQRNAVQPKNQTPWQVQLSPTTVLCVILMLLVVILFIMVRFTSF